MSRNYQKTAITIVLTLLFVLSFNMAASEQSSERSDAGLKHAENNQSTDSNALIDGLSEDEWVIRAIWFEENNAFSKSREIYSSLYAATGKKEYLFKEVSSSIYSNTHIGESLKKLKSWNEVHPDDLAGKRLLLALYMNTKSFAEAAKIGSYILKHSDKDSDLELAANPYLYSGEYEKGVRLLRKLYKKRKNENVLLRIAAIEAQYLGEPKKAIRLLETHRRFEDASPEVYKMLIDLYIKEQDIEQVLSLYKALYEKEMKPDYLNKIMEIYIYNHDFDALIKFLESNHANDEILYDLYKKEKHYEKAIKLAETFYLEDNNPRWLAEKGVLTFESAKDKENRKMLEEVVSLFEQAIKKGVDDSIYLNYYGYTLINKDMDIEKGIELVQKALEQMPDNSYYQDSLAWGYYKKHECLKAYTVMEKVVAREGTKEPEIKEHWKRIRECQKPVIVGSR